MDLNIHQSTSKGLDLMGNQPTMTSIELREVINTARKEFGENPVRNDDFIKRIEDELDGELGRCETFAAPITGTPMKGYHLTLDQCLLVGMRESKAVRRSVLAQLKKRQGRVPQTLPEALRLAADLVEQNAKISYERDEAIRTKAQIGNSREATAMATASAAKREAKRLKDELGKGVNQATVTAVGNATGMKLGRKDATPLSRWCKERGVTANHVPDGRYGKVRAWPAGAWLDCFGVDLQELFGGEA